MINDPVLSSMVKAFKAERELYKAALLARDQNPDALQHQERRYSSAAEEIAFYVASLFDHSDD